MQPTLMKLLNAVNSAVEGDACLVDTHNPSAGFWHPRAQPDCSSLAGQLPTWPSVIFLWEWKLGSKPANVHTMMGQQVERCNHVFAQQPERAMLPAVSITMDTFELLIFNRLPAGAISVSRTGQLQFSVDASSAGFRMLVRVLATPKADLGFMSPDLPNLPSLGAHQIKDISLIQRGSAPEGRSSYVFKAKFDGKEAVLKLNRSGAEVRVRAHVDNPCCTVVFFCRTHVDNPCCTVVVFVGRM